MRHLLRACICIFAFGAFSSQVSAQAVSGAPWGARDPAQCTPLSQAEPPSAEQAAQLFRCLKDTASNSTGELWLAEDVAIDVGGGVPFETMFLEFNMQDADVTKAVHPIRGGWTWSKCKERAGGGVADPALNCTEIPVTNAKGGCWQTVYGEWKCWMNGSSGSESGPVAPRQ